MEPASAPIRGALRDLQPLSVSVVAPGSEDLRLFNGLLARYHYLGHRNTVGENLRYLVRDRHGRPVACALFGSAAWKCADRDAFLGWDRATRERNLQGLTNNTRFLIPAWVEVPHLASHVLGLIARRIRADWQAKYGHPVHALETFVDRERFKGTCYRAANWLRLGATRGRTRNDRAHRIRAAVKDVYLYPLVAGLPAGVVRMMTRQEAEAIYDAGKETVVRVLLDMDRRIHALECQVQDLTAPKLEVTEHQGEVKTCACGRVNRAAFPPEAAAPVQYGPRVKSAAIYLKEFSTSAGVHPVGGVSSPLPIIRYRMRFDRDLPFVL